jgi:hypothetical protein
MFMKFHNWMPCVFTCVRWPKKVSWSTVSAYVGQVFVNSGKPHCMVWSLIDGPNAFTVGS